MSEYDSDARIIPGTVATMTYSAPYTPREEFANAMTHGIGCLVAVVALYYMISIMPLHLTGWQKAGIVIYGISLVLMFLSSTLYHAISQPNVKHILKRFDHCAIYLLIAGSFTPLLTITIDSLSSKVVLSAVWAMAIIGLVFKAFFAGRYKWISVGSYLLMGWLSVVVIYQLYQALPLAGFALLVFGGLAYSVGVMFYLNKNIPFNHAIWHCFVFAGAMSHCGLIALYVLTGN